MKLDLMEYDIDKAIYIADAYLKMAVSASADLDEEQDIGAQSPKRDSLGPLYVTMSSLAFAIEIYLKAIAYSQSKSTLTGHDLLNLWGEQKQDLTEFVEEKFALNFELHPTPWLATLAISTSLKGRSSPVTVTVEGENVSDILSGHRRAFERFRYGYEMPRDRGIKLIEHNIPALRLIAWIVREAAYAFKHAREEAIDEYKHVRGRKIVSVEICMDPSEPIIKFPP